MVVRGTVKRTPESNLQLVVVRSDYLGTQENTVDKRIICLQALGLFALAGCATSPATREHMLATFAKQNGYHLVNVNGNEEYCSTKTYGNHPCVSKVTMAWYMDHTLTTIPWVSSS